MRKWIIIVLLVGFSLNGYGQRERSIDREKLDAARVAFITNRLSLTPDQAELFWPLFNEYQESREELMRDLRGISKKGEEESISNAEASQLIEQRFSLQQELLNQEKEFMEKVSEALTPVQALQLNETNRDFTRHIYRMQRRNRENNPRE
ncbi:Spy/CpxP family protein refolding chaperone [Cyclobacterium jeungdonense]|uniref:Spy/CpxP family protein refolding chaperone n=1 Tax=Cyclobacterium jeungdonense TaxID=708087 RepID=A0ABT8CEX0_9BACT|nr:Spy/CpxP family protein refolding chaperone [Cyclobacterium jeungdonense]MDN3690270.1 Spy/CpxP family protein refolding chaperone [Cyclobacterium jeungdonense]